MLQTFVVVKTFKCAREAARELRKISKIFGGVSDVRLTYEADLYTDSGYNYVLTWAETR